MLHLCLKNENDSIVFGIFNANIFSDPHRKDFAWNLLYLKQSWGANLNSPKKQAPETPSLAPSTQSSRTSSNKTRNHRSDSSIYKIAHTKSSKKVSRKNTRWPKNGKTIL